MTVAALTPRVDFLEDGLTLDFTVPFRFASSTIAVSRVLANGTEIGLVSDIDFTTAGGNTDAGGSLKLASTLAGSKLLIRRRTPRAQAIQYETNDRFPAKTHEGGFDYDMLIEQEQDTGLAEYSERALLTPRGEVGGILPSAADRAGYFLAFGANGDPVRSSGTGGGDQYLRIDLANQEGSQLIGHRARSMGDSLDDVINVLDYGVIGDDVVDDAAALDYAAALARGLGKTLYCPRLPGQIYIGSAVDLRGVRQVEINTPVRASPAIAGVPVTLGGFAHSIVVDWWLTDVTDGTNVISAPPPARPIVRVIGAKAGSMHFGGRNYLQFYAASELGSAFNSIAYNDIHLDGVVSLLEITDSGVGTSWINENRFHGGRIVRLRIIGVGYTHNHNKFFDNTFEGANVELTFVRTTVNRMYGARFEGVALAPGISFDARCYSNSIESTWSGTGNPRAEFNIAIPVVDLGSGNAVYSQSMAVFTCVPLFSVSAASGIVSSASDTSARSPRIAAFDPGLTLLASTAPLVPGLVTITAPANRWIALTDPIPVKRGDVVKFDADYSGDAVRSVIFVMDEMGRPLLDEGTGGVFVSQAGVTFKTSGGYYSHTSDVSAHTLEISPAAVVRSEVAYIRVGLFRSIAGPIRSIGASLYVQPFGRGGFDRLRRRQRQAGHQWRSDARLCAALNGDRIPFRRVEVQLRLCA